MFRQSKVNESQMSQSFFFKVSKIKQHLQAIAFCLFAFLCQSQEREQHINEVNVVFKKLLSIDSLNGTHQLDRKEIEALQPEDLGELLKKMPGTNLKAYGGLGGLKTVSIRGLGSQHTQVVIDGFGQTNTQTGQLNLGQLNLENVNSVVLQPGLSSDLKIPASAQLSGNALVIQSFQSSKPTKPINLRFTSRLGSFGQVDESLILKLGTSNFYGGGFFKFRRANGNYPYLITNYESTELKNRKNNDYQDINAGIDLHFNYKKHTINFYFSYFNADQGLPGAVVLYNDFAKQRLASTSRNYKLDYTTSIKKVAFRFYANASIDSLRYQDPFYFGTNSIFTSSFTTRTGTMGINANAVLKKHVQLNFGTEQIMSDLHSQQSLHATPSRSQNFTFLKGTYKKNTWNFIAQLGSQYIQERNSSGISAKDVMRFTPFFEIGKTIKKRYSVFAFYRNSFRMPSFNELYYNNIGNTSLKPEDAHQFSLNNSFVIIERKKLGIGLQLANYYQRVNNMILAIPSKNLFVWTIQNIGKNEIIGSDVVLTMNYNWIKNWRTEVLANYTYQHSVDISNQTSPTYLHQLAYIPRHTTNLDLTILYKKNGIRVSSFYSSKRYSLNENIPANEIVAFAILDFSIFGNFEIGKCSKIRAQFTVKNSLNSSYAYVRSFIMPGRNYLITLTYEIR